MTITQTPIVQFDSHFADTYEGRMTCIKVGTGSRIPPPGCVFLNSVLGRISAVDDYIFTKFGLYIEIRVLQCAEWSKLYTFLENLRQQMAAILNYLYRYNMAADGPIWLKFLHGDIYERPRKTANVNVETGSRIPQQGDFSNSVLRAYLRYRSRHIHQIWCVHRKMAQQCAQWSK